MALGSRGRLQKLVICSPNLHETVSPFQPRLHIGCTGANPREPTPVAVCSNGSLSLTSKVLACFGATAGKLTWQWTSIAGPFHQIFPTFPNCPGLQNGPEHIPHPKIIKNLLDHPGSQNSSEFHGPILLVSGRSTDPWPRPFRSRSCLWSHHGPGRARLDDLDQVSMGKHSFSMIV